MDIYFSADVETDGPIPGPFSMLSFGLMLAGQYDGKSFESLTHRKICFYRELQPISDSFDAEAMQVNGLDRDRLCKEGLEPAVAMEQAYQWIIENSGNAKPVLVAFPLSFDWTWLYWYFVRYCKTGSPFSFSSCFDLKTAFSVKSKLPIAKSGKSGIFENLKPKHAHTHHALDDAIEQAELFVNIFRWDGLTHD